MTKQLFVSQLLKGVGLEDPQISYNFRKAGITSAKQLAALEPCDYDALLKRRSARRRRVPTIHTLHNHNINSNINIINININSRMRNKSGPDITNTNANTNTSLSSAVAASKLRIEHEKVEMEKEEEEDKKKLYFLIQRIRMAENSNGEKYANAVFQLEPSESDNDNDNCVDGDNPDQDPDQDQDENLDRDENKNKNKNENENDSRRRRRRSVRLKNTKDNDHSKQQNYYHDSSIEQGQMGQREHLHLQSRPRTTSSSASSATAANTTTTSRRRATMAASNSVLSGSNSMNARHQRNRNSVRRGKREEEVDVDKGEDHSITTTSTARSRRRRQTIAGATTSRLMAPSVSSSNRSVNRRRGGSGNDDHSSSSLSNAVARRQQPSRSKRHSLEYTSSSLAGIHMRSLSTTGKRRTDGSGRLHARRSLSAPSKSASNCNNNASAPSVFVHGEKKDDSWKILVEDLRVQNAFEYDTLLLSDKENDHSEDSVNDDHDMRIRVVVRKRPMSSKENDSGDTDIIHPLVKSKKVFVYQPKVRVDLTREVETLKFRFDNAFAEDASNEDIYNQTCKTLIPNVFDGSFSSVFAYGQTGSGKTFTMMGSNFTAGGCKDNLENSGLYYLAARDIFSYREQYFLDDVNICVSLFEIYGGKLYDLLENRAQVRCLEDRKGKVCFPGLSEHSVDSADDLIELIENGAINRSTGVTSANEGSSRSHAVLQISLNKLRQFRGRESKVEHGRLTFIDLAGSERGADTNQSNKTTRLEGAEINTSLLALKEVIRALAIGSSTNHIPFRGSKLTQVLKESFVGKSSQAVMVACVAPNLTNCEHTLNTLRYADRVKERDPHNSQPISKPNKERRQSIQSKSRLANTGRRASTAPAEKLKVSNSRGRQTLATPSEIRRSPRSVDKESLPCCHKMNMTSISSTVPTEHNSAQEKKELAPSSRKTSFASDDFSLIIENVFEGEDNQFFRDKENEIAEAGKSLIKTHREVMAQMLKMMKSEMALVHSADENKGDVLDYVEKLDEMQREKLELIESLRKNVASYQALRKAPIN